MRRRETIASFGQTLMVIGGTAIPILLVGHVKGVPLKAAVCILLFGFFVFGLTLVWRGGIDATHRAAVLALVGRAGQLADGVALDIWVNDSEQRAFRAHLPRKATMQVERVKHATSAESSAWQTLGDAVEQNARGAFPSSE